MGQTINKVLCNFLKLHDYKAFKKCNAVYVNGTYNE